MLITYKQYILNSIKISCTAKKCWPVQQAHGNYLLHSAYHTIPYIPNLEWCSITIINHRLSSQWLIVRSSRCSLLINEYSKNLTRIFFI